MDSSTACVAAYYAQGQLQGSYRIPPNPGASQLRCSSAVLVGYSDIGVDHFFETAVYTAAKSSSAWPFSFAALNCSFAAAATGIDMSSWSLHAPPTVTVSIQEPLFFPGPCVAYSTPTADSSAATHAPHQTVSVRGTHPRASASRMSFC